MKVTLLKKLRLENNVTVLPDEMSERIAGGQSEEDVRFNLNLPFEGQMAGYGLMHIVQSNQYFKCISQEDSFL